MKVLVAVDQDLESRLALRYTCYLLEHVDAEVEAIHVKKDVGNIILEDFDIPFLKKDHKKKIDEEAKEVEAAISDACEICLEGKVPCEPRILVGDPAEVIIRGDPFLGGGRHQDHGNAGGRVRDIHDADRVEMGAGRLGLCPGLVFCQRSGQAGCVQDRGQGTRRPGVQDRRKARFKFGSYEDRKMT